MYDPVKYWNERMSAHGHMNTTSGGLAEIESKLIANHVDLYSYVLDYGAGEGRLIPRLASMHCKCVGYDIADLTNIIKEKVDVYEANYTYYPIGKIDKLPFPDKHFDTVIAFSVLTHCTPETVEFVASDILRLGKTCIVSAYNDTPLKYDPETYCYSHDYDTLFAKLNCEIVSYNKVGKMGFWVIRKNH